MTRTKRPPWQVTGITSPDKMRAAWAAWRSHRSEQERETPRPRLFDLELDQ